MKDAGYVVSHKRINSLYHGVPQHRERLYVAGIDKAHVSEERVFQWPKTLAPPPLKPFLDRMGTEGPRSSVKDTATTRRNMEKAKELAAMKMINLGSAHNTAVVDVQAGANFEQVTENYIPCLTRGRAKGGGYYIWGKKRMMTINEMARCQGTDLKRLDVSMFSRTSISAALGNAMTRSALDRIMPRLLFAAGLLSEVPPDTWAQAHSSGRYSDPL